MSAAVAVRAAALAAAAILRHRGPRAALPVVGFLTGVGLFGLGPAELPDAWEAALLSTALATFLALLVWPVWPPVATESAECAAFLGLPVAAWAVFVLRGRPAGELFLAASVAAAVVAAFAAGGSQAAGEAGWRRPAHWVLAVGAAASEGAAFGAAAQAVPPRFRALLGLSALLMVPLAFVPSYVREGRRVLRELGEEAKLGLLPHEDVEVLARPWRRAREARFGRADERRTYVRSALLLAVALQQQRRRSGDAVRLRQLEVLAFRTRVRRTLDARAARAAAATDELTLPA